MLALGRKKGEGIVIGGTTRVVVLEIRGGRVMLGIEAPREVKVLRQELVRPGEREMRDLELLPTTEEIHAVVEEEVGLLGGTVSECFDNGRQLFLRSIFPHAQEVRPKDFVRGGVAVAVDGREISVHHYVLRQVCRNGAIGPVNVQTRRVERQGLAASTEAIAEVVCSLRDAVRKCSASHLLSAAVEQLRSAAERPAEVGVLRSMLRAYLGRPAVDLHAEIVRRFQRDQDRSVFGLMNAVTSTARDEADPKIRWRLEELGGAIPAMVLPTIKPDGAAKDLVAVA